MLFNNIIINYLDNYRDVMTELYFCTCQLKKEKKKFDVILPTVS
jgi:hypothetical protein